MRIRLFQKRTVLDAAERLSKMRHKIASFGFLDKVVLLTQGNNGERLE